ncbi:PHB depolymerase family esterase [Halobacillus rhizosphaerae]|uniref:alpha/beta hydrolase family esterase n=1 Tax=Halobacillus rhizosphaerae TaxID=3064889 RepID=UPI00398A9DF6
MNVHQLYQEVMWVGGKERTFYYQLPSIMPEAAPLVFCFHGAGSHAQHHMKLTQFHEVSEQQQFITVFPEAWQSDPDDRMSKQWNEGRRKNSAFQHQINDVEFVLEMIEWFKRTYPIDNQRIYAEGFSNGSAFSLKLGIECQDTFAGVGGVAGPLVIELAENINWQKPMPLVFIMGTGDQFVPYDGRYSDAYMIDQLISAEETGALFASSWNPRLLKQQEDLLDPSQSGKHLVTKTSYVQTDGDEKVILYTLHGSGHTWPGGPESQSTLLTGKVMERFNATQAIWDHLKNFSRTE